MTQDKLKVRLDALVARINRRLVASGEVLRRCRNERDRANVGDWFALNLSRNSVSRKHVDVEDLAREVGALAEYEELES